MLVLNKTNTGFVHIPKCGGRSVVVQCQKFDHNHHGEITGTHSRASKILERGYKLDNFIVQVRNPYTRFVSAYHHQIEEQVGRLHWTLDQILDCLYKGKLSEFPDPGILRRQVDWYEPKLNMKFFRLEDKTIWPWLNDNGFSGIQEKVSGAAQTDKKIELYDFQKEIVYNFYKQDFETFGYNK